MKHPGRDDWQRQYALQIALECTGQTKDEDNVVMQQYRKTAGQNSCGKYKQHMPRNMKDATTPLNMRCGNPKYGTKTGGHARPVLAS